MIKLNRSIFLVLIISLFMMDMAFSQNAIWGWGQRAGGIGSGSTLGSDEEATDIAVDDSGNVYVCGAINHSGSPSFDTTIVKTYGQNDIFIAKYSCDGELLWVKTGGNRQSSDIAVAIEIDTLRDIVYFSGSLRAVRRQIKVNFLSQKISEC